MKEKEELRMALPGIWPEQFEVSMKCPSRGEKWRSGGLEFRWETRTREVKLRGFGWFDVKRCTVKSQKIPR